MEINLKNLTEEDLTIKNKDKFHDLAADELRRRQMQANEAAMQPLLIRLDHISRRLDIIVELLLERKTKGDSI